jgi:peptidyl-prolyl cis-trans isomerase SurA
VTLGTPVRLVLALAVSGSAAAAQSSIPVDRIVAIVASQPILDSELEEQIAQAQASGQTVPQDSAGRAAYMRQLLSNMIDTELLVQQAERDTTVKVTEQEVQEAVEQTVKTVRSRFTAEAEFQRQVRLAFGTVEEWRRLLTREQRRAILQQRLIENLRQKEKIKPIPPTDAQMREFWDQNKGEGQQRPATISFRQIIVTAQPDSAARAEALTRIDSLLVALRGGADFATVARQFSDDSTTRDSGGTLGWFRRGTMVKEFEAVAFRLRPGQISNVVETEFGYHVIQVERVQPAEVLARHVLIAPRISPAQIAAARARADTVRAALANGESFDSLARRFGDESAPKLAEAVPLTQLGPEYQQLLEADTTVGLKPVVGLNLSGLRPQFAVVDVTARQPAGALSFEDVREQIRSQLSQQLGVQHYVDQLRRQTYIDIRL